LKGRAVIDRLAVRKGKRWIEKVSGTSPVTLYAQRARVKKSKNREDSCRERFVGRVRSVTVEQSGPVRVVVKIDGAHTLGSETFLPFTLRLYFHAGCNTIRMVHTFFYDGDSKKDLVGGLGVDFPVTMSDPVHNRHVFMALEDGIWHEPVSVLPPWPPIIKRGDVIKKNEDYGRQYAFKYLGHPAPAVTPVWNEYCLLQESCDSFFIDKAVSGSFGAVPARRGRRSRGWGGVVAPQGGVAVGIRDFWQAFPSAVALRNGGASEEAVVLSAELWPSRVGPLDMRHYSGEAYKANYESVVGAGPTLSPGWVKTPVAPWQGNPYGIGRTSELTFHVLNGHETTDIFENQAALTANPPVVTCPPRQYRIAKVFSPWSLPSKTKLLRPLEEKLAEVIDIVVRQVEENRWYGFIDYGDFQICRDRTKKDWKYDEGGHAWINEELLPGVFLWQMFLRTGRLDVFRRAEAMSRHAEVDMFHIGPLRGIGTRHNVKHWGCGNHEIRQSMAGNKRYHHLITGDERSRDIILEECPDVGKAWVYIERSRKATGKRGLSDDVVNGTLGPHLSSFFWNWLSVWEMTGCRKHRDMVVNGALYMARQNQPCGLAGRSMSYEINFETGELRLLVPHAGKPPMANMFGAEEIWLEMVNLLDSEEWTEAVCKYGEMHVLDTFAERSAVAPEAVGHGSSIEDRALNSGGIQLIAFCGVTRRNRRMMKQAVEKLLTGRAYTMLISGADNRTFANWGRQAIATIAVLERYARKAGCSWTGSRKRSD